MLPGPSPANLSSWSSFPIAKSSRVALPCVPKKRDGKLFGVLAPGPICTLEAFEERHLAVAPCEQHRLASGPVPLALAGQGRGEGRNVGGPDLDMRWMPQGKGHLQDKLVYEHGAQVFLHAWLVVCSRKG